MYVCVCGLNTGHCACISPQLGLASLSPLYLLIHAWRLLYLMPIHHIYIYLYIASLGAQRRKINMCTFKPSLDLPRPLSQYKE